MKVYGNLRYMCDIQIQLFLNYVTFTINIVMFYFSFHCDIVTVAFKYTSFITPEN